MKNKQRIIFSLSMFFAAFTSTYVHPHPSALNQLLIEIKQSQQNAINSAAVVILVSKDKVLINLHLGKVSWESDKPFTLEDRFRIGSISKSFAALLAMRMSEAGKLDIRLPFTHYVDKLYIENPFVKTPVTLEQLLEHTSGLSGLSADEWKYNKSDELTIAQTLNLNKGDHKTHWKPGLHHSYSNAGFGLLGLALEKAGGKSYEELMSDYVFEPLKMRSSSLLLDKITRTKLIAGYDTDGKTTIPYWHNIYRPFAAVNTNAEDMVKFLQMLLNKGKINETVFLSKKSIKRIETPKTSLSAKGGLRYGYGLANYSWQRKGVTFKGHGGDADGYLSRYGYNRESGLAYFVMVNAFNYKPLGKLRHLLENYIGKNVVRAKAKGITLPTKLLQDYSGDYVSVTNRFSSKKKERLTIFQRDNELYLQENSNQTYRIYPVTKTHFRYFNETVATIAFVKYNGELFLQADIGNYKQEAQKNRPLEEK